ncbi:MAG: hypothetical protein IT222_02510 [Crocinitomix sp.]|nr:hypothetical protein [Crocinitomix sp.]
MGYLVYVNCNCYKNGMTSDPPKKEFVRIVEERVSLDFQQLLLINDKTLRDKIEEDFYNWKETACEHPFMKIAYEYLDDFGVDSMIEYFQFWHEQLPITTKYAPRTHEGMFPIDHAKAILEELDPSDFEPEYEKMVFLNEKSKGINIINTDILSDYYTMGSILIQQSLDGKYGCSLGQFGFNISEDRGTSFYSIFRSSEFTQRTILENQPLKVGDVPVHKCEFIDKETGKSVICGLKLKPFDYDTDEDLEFIVSYGLLSVLRGYEYTYIVTALLKLAEISIETGNRMVWTKWDQENSIHNT